MAQSLRQTAMPGQANDNEKSTLHVVAHVTETADTFVGGAHKVMGQANKYLNIVSANHAFRRVQAEASGLMQPVLNKAHNLRGNVVSARWRAVFNLSIGYAEKLEKVEKLAHFLEYASYLSGWAEEIEKVSKMQAPWQDRAAHLSFYATTAAVKMVNGTAKGILTGGLYAMQAGCVVGGAVGRRLGADTLSPAQCAGIGDQARVMVAVGAKTVEDNTTPEALRDHTEAAMAWIITRVR